MFTSNNDPNYSLYAGNNPRLMPAYTFEDAARASGVPLETVRTWVTGRRYKIGSSKPIIIRPISEIRLLSFTNLIEIHVLNAIRRKHKIQMKKVRIALDYLKEKYNSEHPLAEQTFETDGRDLFIEKFSQLINISRGGQLEMRGLFDIHLRRIERDEQGFALRLYPFVRRKEEQEPRFIVIDPFVSFGKPVLTGTGIPTRIIAERYKTGESVSDLVEDYGRGDLEINEAIRFELQLDSVH